jgi:hypothetical protein
MASLGKVTLMSASGEKYRFKVFPLGTRFRSISGVYLITQRTNRADGRHRHKILDVGHTADFSQPADGRSKAQNLTQLGANCICVQSDVSAKSRQDKELDLVATFGQVRTSRDEGSSR